MNQSESMSMDIDEREKIYQGLNSMMRMLLEVDDGGRLHMDRKKVRYAREIGLIELINKVLNGEKVLEEAENFYKVNHDPYMQEQMEFKLGRGNYFEIALTPADRFLSDEYVKKPFNWNSVEMNTEVITEFGDKLKGYGLGYFQGYDNYTGKVFLNDFPFNPKFDGYDKEKCYPKGSRKFNQLIRQHCRWEML